MAVVDTAKNSTRWVWLNRHGRAADLMARVRQQSDALFREYWNCESFGALMTGKAMSVDLVPGLLFFCRNFDGGESTA